MTKAIPLRPKGIILDRSLKAAALVDTKLVVK